MSVTWIPLLVPEPDYVELAQRVAELARERGDDAPASPVDIRLTPAGGVPRQASPDDVSSKALAELTPWSIDDLRRLARGETLTTQRWTKALDVCSQRVGEFISTEEIAANSEMRVEEWRDAPRKIQRHLDRHYPDVEGWPLAAVSGRSLGHSYDQVYWAITAEQAQRWKEAREEAK